MGVRLLDFLSGLSGALDLMSSEVVGHHKRVAYLASRLAKALGVEREERTELFMAAVLHDVGGFTLQSRLAALSFEADGARHAELGYRLLRDNPLLDDAAVIVRHHHTPRSRYPVLDEPERKLFLSGILNLADRLDVLTLRFKACEPAEIMGHIRPRMGYQFEPQAVEALGDLAADPMFWAPLASADPTQALTDDPDLFEERGVSHGQLLQASTAFSQIIDFRSRFTATHSRGVAETAVCLAEKAGLPAEDLVAMRLAGDLHDLGKLAVPSEIIDKPGPLNAEEKAVMQRHPELGEAILSSVPGLEKVTAWASQHHEQLGGLGYPRGLAAGDIPLGSRIMSLADVFTALREDRPYRVGMANGQTLNLLDKMAVDGALDPELVSLMRRNLDELDIRRCAAQARAAAEFRRFYDGVPRQ
ncbi:MAG TPA: HD domain-containing phosphohydrolase [Humidesulfovibrio sp.]|uniref:HD-GYP domain-containing protein n=1 Tax=Humidesulfovibrio sp. TaxID=2910988 RepID=UPI002CE9B4E8|nr:HD domain-containing phosphohydrolase [Humidesulfovibrio sp.]HWR04264.1 HD domain-containing phosphohydrolase [Humidesulfovibrio sp.]